MTKRFLTSPIFLVLLGALFLRLPFLSGSFWLDEAAQALESVRPLNQQLQIAQDFQPPLIHLVIHFASRLSRAEWWLRSVAALAPGLITIWATYRIGKLMINKKVGLLASLFLATSSFHIFYSQELRPYSLPAMWAVLSWLALLKISYQQSSKKTLLIFTIFTLLGLYSSYLYPFLILSQLFFILIIKRQYFKFFVSSLSLSVIFFIPWLPKFLEQLRVGQQVRLDLPGWEKVVSISQIKSPLLVFAKFVFGVLDVEPNFIFASLSLLILFLAGFLAKSRLKQNNKIQKGKLLVFATWFLVPVLTAWIISFFVPVLRPKRVLFLLPAWFLLFATLSTQEYKTKISSLAAKLLIALVVSINLVSTLGYYTNQNYQREDWRSLHQNILENYSKEKTAVIFSFPGPFAPWRWYDDGSYPALSTGTLHIDQADLESTFKPVDKYDHVLVFDYLRNLTDPQNKMLKKLEAKGWKGVGVIDQPNIGFVRIYTQKENK